MLLLRDLKENYKSGSYITCEIMWVWNVYVYIITYARTDKYTHYIMNDQ